MPDQAPGRPVRKARPDEYAVVGEVLGDAFRDDPLMTWLVPREGWRHRAVPDYFLAVARHVYLPRQEVYLAEGASGAALWLPPGAPPGRLPALRAAGLLWRLFRASGLTGLRRARAVSLAMQANHPAQPHFYLHAVGVRRGQQGRGVGSALIRQVTERCDRDGALAYLENTNERNLPLYERNGFRVVREWRAPGGPTLWFMERAARRP
jgi:ribosomal protein S18 acetylase RimI-like enzyme